MRFLWVRLPPYLGPSNPSLGTNRPDLRRGARKGLIGNKSYSSLSLSLYTRHRLIALITLRTKAVQ